MSYPKLSHVARRALVEAPFPTIRRVPGKTHAGTLIREVDNIFRMRGSNGEDDSIIDNGVAALEQLLERS